MTRSPALVEAPPPARNLSAGSRQYVARQGPSRSARRRLTEPRSPPASRARSIHQFHGAVMANLQALGQIADRRAMTLSVESLYGQQQLALLRFQAVGPRSPLAEMQKLADLVAELRERPDLLRRYGFGPFNGTVQENPRGCSVTQSRPKTTYQSIDYVDYNPMRRHRQVRHGHASRAPSLHFKTNAQRQLVRRIPVAFVLSSPRVGRSFAVPSIWLCSSIFRFRNPLGGP